MAETGTSVGEISGQSKCINTCDFRPSRPFRIVTGSEDNTVAVFEGPPFKFKMTKQVRDQKCEDIVKISPCFMIPSSTGTLEVCTSRQILTQWIFFCFRWLRW